MQNTGTIILNQARPAEQRTLPERTVIVSGAARSGTSMVARVLHAAGVPMGSDVDQVVFEDAGFSVLFEQRTLDRQALRALVDDRNRNHAVWGFKRPHLHEQDPAIIGMFRNPLVVLIVRDLVAVAERNVISEMLDPAVSLAAAANDLQRVIGFARSLTCPVLLLSYEKALQNRPVFVDSLTRFCGLDLPEAERARLAGLVEPDRPAYVESARRRFEGYIDGVRDTTLVGWACQYDMPLPVKVTVFRDGIPIRDVIADRYRQDLAAAGVGAGRHGFEIDLREFRFTRESRVSVRIHGRTFELKRSGQTTVELGAHPQHIEQHPFDPWMMMREASA